MKNKTLIFFDFESTGVARDADMISLGMVAVTLKPKSVTNMQKEFEDRISALAVGLDFKEPWTSTIEEVKSIYCEFTDYSANKCVDWVKKNVIPNLTLDYLRNPIDLDDLGEEINGVDNITNEDNIKMLGTTSHISKHLKEWLLQFDNIEFWSDYGYNDTVYLQELIGDWSSYRKDGVASYSHNIKYYNFFDLHTLIKSKNIDPDIIRSDLALSNGEGVCSHIEAIKKLDIISNSYNLNAHNSLYNSYIIWKCYKKLITL